MSFFKKRYFLVSLLTVILILVGLMSFQTEIKQAFKNKVQSPPAGKSNFAPFEEITIPYLRNKKYESSLGEIAEIYKHQNYTSYLTSFNSDGLKINALLTKPTGSIPKNGFPAIVFVHGYIPPSEYSTLERYSDYVDYLARNGFVVFKIDLRGNGTSEGQAQGAYFSSGYVIDTLNAYSALQNSGFVNPEKIGLWGHSMAGNVVLRAMAVKKDIPAVDMWAGAVYTYVDQREYAIHDLSYRPSRTITPGINSRQSLYEKVGSPSANSPFWKVVAPTNYLSDIKGALQINHALDDNVVDIRYSENLNMLLDKTSIHHEFYKYESGGHNISGSSFTLAMERTVDFFKKYLR